MYNHLPAKRLARVFVPVLLVAALALAPSVADARLGGGGSMGSRGSRTYSAPAPTNTIPYAPSPMQRSMTPNAPSPGFGGAPAGAPAFGGRSAFTSGLLGGLIGAGIGGMLFGHGMFGGISGIGGLFGFLLQIFLIVMVVRFLLRRFGGAGGARQPMFAGPGGMFARNGAAAGAPPGVAPGGGPSGGYGGGAGARQVTITPADFNAFEQTLIAAQAAWTNADLNALRALGTPEMASYFAEQLADQASRGVRNSVTDVRLLQGDLSEAWAESGREYATVAMRFSMVDVTRDQTGRIVDGSADEHVTAAEVWTFLRAPGGRWLLSAIQQGR